MELLIFLIAIVMIGGLIVMSALLTAARGPRGHAGRDARL
ncbi:hypothetical protein SANTM175S_02484 [Streptomyces antimycoticus]